MIDSRVEDRSVRRRRECLDCQQRFTTYERMEVSVMVVKRDGQREVYDRTKILEGIRRAGKKRPAVLEQAEQITNRIEQRLMTDASGEIPSQRIGEYVMEALKHLDPVAYLRFTSVCRSFEDVESFATELATLTPQTNDS